MNRFASSVVFGKFWPLHVGHEALLREATEQSESVLIVVDDGPEDVPTSVRVDWIKELFPSALVVTAPDLCGHDTASCTKECSKTYAAWLRTHHGEVDAVFAGDPYGELLAAELGSAFVPVDRSRTGVEGRVIRADIPAHWEQLTAPAKAWFCRRVVVIGAESTGTTTLASELATRLCTRWVPEYGREFTERHGLDHSWVSVDFDVIAQRQTELEELGARFANRVLVCDTDVLATAVWHERYLGSISASITELASTRRPDVYLLTSDDIPFVQDGWRDGEGIRQWMATRLRQEVMASEAPWLEVCGSRTDRLNEALRFIEAQLGPSWVTVGHS